MYIKLEYPSRIWFDFFSRCQIKHNKLMLTLVQHSVNEPLAKVYRLSPIQMPNTVYNFPNTNTLPSRTSPSGYPRPEPPPSNICPQPGASFLPPSDLFFRQQDIRLPGPSERHGMETERGLDTSRLRSPSHLSSFDSGIGPLYDSYSPPPALPSRLPDPTADTISTLTVDAIATEFGFGEVENRFRAQLHGFVKVSAQSFPNSKNLHQEIRE
jgi:hypothetical protein